MAQVQNPAFPRITDVIDFVDGPNTPVQNMYTWVDVTWRGRGRDQIAAGKQYELDAQRAGDRQTTLDTADAAFDPTNSSSPFYPQVKLQRPWRRLAQYPVNQNLFSPDQATACTYSFTVTGQNTTSSVLTGYTSGLYINDQAGYLYAVSDCDTNAGITAVSDGPNAACPNVYHASVGTAVASGTAIIALFIPVVPGRQYTLQCVARSVTSGGNPNVMAQVQWLGSSGTVTATTSGTAATLTGASSGAPWTQVTVTATAPNAGVFGMKVSLALNTAPGVASTVQATAFQIEYGATATAFTQPGALYCFGTRYTERYPQRYSQKGSYAETDIVGSDLLAVLAQIDVFDAVGNTVQLNTPSWYYRLDDPQGSTSAADAAGRQLPAVPTHSPYSGTGALVFGSSITVSSGSPPAGMEGSVATLTNPGGLAQQGVAYVDLLGGGMNQPSNGTGVGAPNWTRLIMFRAPALPPAGNTAGSYLWYTSGGNQFAIVINPTTGTLTISLQGVSTAISYTTAGSVCDGNWHTIAVSGSTSQVIMAVDGSIVNTAAQAPWSTTTISAYARADSIGARVVPAITFDSGFTGDVAHVAEMPTALTGSALTFFWSVATTARAGESTDQRWLWLLRSALPGYIWSVGVDAGSTTSLAASSGTLGRSALEALTTITDTELGQMYVTGWGQPRFRSRLSRPQSMPVLVLGERTDLGEIPYDPDVAFDFDLTRVVSRVTVTQQPAGQQYVAYDIRATSQPGRATMNRDNWASSSRECQDEAYALLTRYQDPHLRLNQVTIRPHLVGAWSLVLGLAQGQRLRVMRRPIGSNSLVWDGYVEKNTWSFRPADVSLVLQASPADPVMAWILQGALTTLQAGAAAGATSIRCLPMSGVVDGVGGFAMGQRLTLDLGSGVAETVTVTGTPTLSVSPSPPNLIVNYVQVPVTALAFTHASGGQVQEAVAAPLSPGSFAQFSILDKTTFLGY